jgi:hypothetical protein
VKPLVDNVLISLASAFILFQSFQAHLYLMSAPQRLLPDRKAMLRRVSYLSQRQQKADATYSPTVRPFPPFTQARAPKSICTHTHTTQTHANPRPTRLHSCLSSRASPHSNSIHQNTTTSQYITLPNLNSSIKLTPTRPGSQARLV